MSLSNLSSSVLQYTNPNSASEGWVSTYIDSKWAESTMTPGVRRKNVILRTHTEEIYDRYGRNPTSKAGFIAITMFLTATYFPANELRSLQDLPLEKPNEFCSGNRSFSTRSRCSMAMVWWSYKVWLNGRRRHPAKWKSNGNSFSISLKFDSLPGHIWTWTYSVGV